MSTELLPINEDLEQLIRRVIEYATAPANFYHVQYPHGRKLPADNLNHVAQLHQYRCIFSIAIIDRKPWRYLSIAQSERGLYAAPIVALTIAKMFGFTGWDGHTPKPPRHWAGRLDREENAVLLFQEYGISR